MTGQPEEKESAVPPDVQFTEEEKEVLAFLAKTRRVDKRWLSEEQKVRIRDVIDQLHNTKNLSLLRISKEVGRSYTAIWKLCRALEIHTRNLAEADRNSISIRSKHKRTPFDGTEEERAYMLGFRHGDLTALQVSGTAVMVTSTTTHPAFAKLFHELFQRYGHVYQYPMYEEGKGYKWKLAVRLDNSFQFLLEPWQEALRLYSQDRKLILAWLAGLVDSDGNIRVGESGGGARTVLTVYSTDRPFLEAVKSAIEEMGYHLDGPYRSAEKGDRTPRGIRYREDFWNIVLQRSSETQSLLKELRVRHSEKVERKELALSVVRENSYNDILPRILELRNKIHSQVQDFIKSAELAHKSRRLKEKDEEEPNGL